MAVLTIWFMFVVGKPDAPQKQRHLRQQKYTNHKRSATSKCDQRKQFHPLSKHNNNQRNTGHVPTPNHNAYFSLKLTGSAKTEQ